MRLALISCAILALASCQKPSSPPAENQTAASARAVGEPAKGVDRTHKGTPAPDAKFTNLDGAQLDLKTFSGQPILLNLWASWCAPCVKELPTLDHLAQLHSKKGDLRVIAVSQDSGPYKSVVAFLDTRGIKELEPYQDSQMALSGGLGPDTVLPTSILFDAKGREVWRYVGDQDWTSPEAAKLLAEGGVAPAG